MPRRRLYITLAVIAIAAVIAVLGIIALVARDDDDDGNDSVGGPTVSVRPTEEPDETAEATETPDDDKTPGPNETPGEETAVPSPIDATPASRGIRATLIENPTSFFNDNYPGVSPVQQNCQYNITEVIVTCDGTEYAPDPPIVTPGVECYAWLVNSERVALSCTSQDPLFTIYYDIQE